MLALYDCTIVAGNGKVGPVYRVATPFGNCCHASWLSQVNPYVVEHFGFVFVQLWPIHWFVHSLLAQRGIPNKTTNKALMFYFLQTKQDLLQKRVTKI